MTVGLVSQQRQGTSLICRANYDVMRGLVDFLVAECCADVSCAVANTEAPAAAPLPPAARERTARRR